MSQFFKIVSLMGMIAGILGLSYFPSNSTLENTSDCQRVLRENNILEAQHICLQGDVTDEDVLLLSLIHI